MPPLPKVPIVVPLLPSTSDTSDADDAGGASGVAKAMAERSLNSGYLKDALQYLQQAHTEDPEDGWVMLKLGWTYNILHLDDLAFHWDPDEVVPAFESSAGIFHECEACSRTFDPSKAPAVITNPFDGVELEVRGGAAYRFALKVDCGKCFTSAPSLAFAPELVALVEDEFGREMHEIGALY